jgi:hypothetical protein
MININIKIFDDFSNWNKNKNLTLFKDKKQLDFYHKYFLNILNKNRNVPSRIILESSGTTNNKPRKIPFPKKIYEVIENHHIWRIINSHRINFGNIVRIFQGNNNNSQKKFIGPIKISSSGLMNDSWDLIYNPKHSDYKFWGSSFDFIKKIKPCFLYTSPSVFSSMCSFLEINKMSFDFPIVFSCETLTDKVRHESEMFFSKSIDKMLDWKTGFGFFECKYKRKHVYDELCIVEQREKDMASSISLFNYCSKIKEQLCSDTMIINQDFCDCGIYGNFLTKFEGKIFECLISKKGNKYSANYISNALSTLNFKLNEYEIIQDKEKNITFNINNEISNIQAMKVKIILDSIIGDNEENLSSFNNNKLIYLSHNSNLWVKFFNKSPKIYRNKTIMVRSYAA